LHKFYHGFGSFINRKFFIDEFKGQYASIIQQFQKDTDLTRVYHREEKESSPPMFGVPATTWISQNNVIHIPQFRKYLKRQK
jgi:hypothetical protein